MESGARGGARLTADEKDKTCKKYGFSGVRNDTWYPVVGDNAAYGNGLDINKLCDYAETASRTTKKAISKLYEWTGVWGAGAACMGGSYLLTAGNDDIHWLNRLFAVLGAISLGKMVDHIEKKVRKYRAEAVKTGEKKNEYASALTSIKRGYYGIMKELMEDELFTLDEKINIRYKDLQVDGFTKELAEKLKVLNCKKPKASDYKTEQLQWFTDDLERMQKCLERGRECKRKELCNHEEYAESRKRDRENWQEEGMVAQL